MLCKNIFCVLNDEDLGCGDINCDEKRCEHNQRYRGFVLWVLIVIMGLMGLILYNTWSI